MQGQKVKRRELESLPCKKFAEKLKACAEFHKVYPHHHIDIFQKMEKKLVFLLEVRQKDNFSLKGGRRSQKQLMRELFAKGAKVVTNMEHWFHGPRIPNGVKRGKSVQKLNWIFAKGHLTNLKGDKSDFNHNKGIRLRLWKFSISKVGMDKYFSFFSYSDPF